MGDRGFALGLMLAFTAQHIRAWPFPHPTLNVVYGLWALTALCMILSYGPAVKANEGLVVPEEPEKLARYGKLTMYALAGGVALAVLFCIPWVTHYSGLSPSAQIAILGASWMAAIGTIAVLVRNRRAWIALMTP